MSTAGSNSQYDKFPEVAIAGRYHEAWQGWPQVIAALQGALAAQPRQKTVLVVECYHGVAQQELLEALILPLRPAALFDAADARRSTAEIEALIAGDLTDDPVFGRRSSLQLAAFFDPAKRARLQQAIADVSHGLVVVTGTGAALMADGDLLVYADLARWEIQQRFRRGELGNYGADNARADLLSRYKRAFFIDWRVLDRHKVPLLQRADFLLDTHQAGSPRLVSGAALHAGLRQVARQPFRVVPFFDPGVWGGQWMKHQFDLDPAAANYAWCFDCVPEENSLLMRFGDVRVEIPALDLVLLYPQPLLGDAAYARFGAEFPIRFDLLDTVGGQNLSLQVHPTQPYIRQQFGMAYTQDESYYLLAAEPDAGVCLGVKTGTRPDEMMAALAQAAQGEGRFDDARFINRFPARRHDHFLIPAGTVHCAGAGSVVLEISATPYLFTFKLWDWGRLGLDGRPRPLHLHHGGNVIDWQRDTDWVTRELVNRVEPLAAGPGWQEERTGLHPSQFIETRRHWFSVPVLHHTDGRVNVLNLIEGEEAVVESPSGSFAPFVVHFAETFIIPAAVGAYRIRPCGRSLGQRLGTLKAWVREEETPC